MSYYFGFGVQQRGDLVQPKLLLGLPLGLSQDLLHVGLALGNGVYQRLILMVSPHHGLQVLVVLAQLDISLHIGRDGRVVHLLLYLTIAGIYSLKFV